MKKILILLLIISSLPAELPTERPREEIQSVINLNLPALRYAFRKRLAEKEISGTVKVWFAVDSTGTVVNDSIVSTTMNDSTFESTIREKIRGWVFNPCSCAEPTEIVYPFTFSSFN